MPGKVESKGESTTRQRDLSPTLEYSLRYIAHYTFLGLLEIL